MSTSQKAYLFISCCCEGLLKTGYIKFLADGDMGTGTKSLDKVLSKFEALKGLGEPISEDT